MPISNPSGPIPAGLIAMFHGLLANISAGWILCDGNGGSPNLLGRFIQGVATDATNPGATGGATNKALADGSSSGHATQSGWVVNPSANNLGMGTGSGSLPIKQQTISDIRPKFYDLAFIMKT